jgi:hypothetical protein
MGHGRAWGLRLACEIPEPMLPMIFGSRRVRPG